MKFDYCRIAFCHYTCEDYINDNCDNCNIYKAYQYGRRVGTATLVELLEKCQEALEKREDI